METASVLDSMLGYKAWANQELFAGLGHFERPKHEDALHQALRILNHTHVVDKIFAAHLSGTPHCYTATNTEQTPTLHELRRATKDVDDWYLAHLQSLTPELLTESVPFVFTDGDAGAMTRAEILIHVVLHGAYHRGAVGRLMFQAGVAPPRDIFTRYLHAVEPSRRNQLARSIEHSRRMM
jgi:uncharacterized damage-inducible protein DinB